jgi:AraC-like DNA-binding protein
VSGLEIVQLPPGPRLRGLVRRAARFTERAEPLRWREVPLPGGVILFSLGPDLLVDGRRIGSFAAGLYDRPVVTGHFGEQAGLQLDVTPLGARGLFGVPMDELFNRTVALEDVLPGARELVERLAEAPDPMAVLDERLAAGAAQVPGEVRHAYARLVASHGRVRVEDLARETGWSRRHLAERFRHEIGMPPKAFARVLRFERAVELLRAGHPLADAAFSAGYADQPHMNRDFRALYGAPPGELPFVQDAPLAA